MAGVQRVGVDEIIGHFHELEDPRSTVNQQYPLVSVVVIALMAILGGAAGPTAIARWAALKKDLLPTLLDLPNGVPGKDVFRRVLMALDPGAFQACFAGWLRSLRRAATEATGVGQPILAVDGKTARRSHDRAKGLGALHAVTVWASEYGLALGCLACAEKSNEITAIPELLRLVDIEGGVITIDAMGCQKAIAAEVIAGKADYVLGLKGNQEALREAVKAHVEGHSNDDFARVNAQWHLTEEEGHGRVESRIYLHLEAPKDLPGREQWEDLKSIGVVTAESLREGKWVAETRYYLSSLEVNAPLFARAARSHWGVENGCHWSLDLIYREDESRIREGRLRQNFAWLNRLTLSLLKQHPGAQSTAMKRRSCAWSDDFMIEVLTGKAVQQASLLR
jgi:predicted transposase YbfD/YdcC